MREIDASESEVHLERLFDDVERGETIIITRHGRPIARIEPEIGRRQEEIDKALADVEALRKSFGEVTAEEILSARHDGHKY